MSSNRKRGQIKTSIKEKKERDSSWDSQERSNETPVRESVNKSSRSGGSVKSSSAYDKYNLASAIEVKQSSTTKHDPKKQIRLGKQ